MTTQEGLPALATDAELAELLAGLKGVTPGPWYISTDDDGEQFIEAKYQTSPLSTYVVSIAYEMRDAELRYLPLVSPDRIRALLDRLEAAERQLHDYQARVIPAETRVVELEHRLLELEEAKSHDD